MSWFGTFLNLISPASSTTITTRRGCRPQLEKLEARDVPTAGPTFQLQPNGNLVETFPSGTTVVVDQNVQTYGIAYGTSGQVNLIDLHTNGVLQQLNPNGNWSTLRTNVKSASVFSDMNGHATVEVLGQDGSLRQYNVFTQQWSLIDWSNVSWMQGVADSTGKLQELFWLNNYGALYCAPASGPGTVIRNTVSSVSVFTSAGSVSLVTQDRAGLLWLYNQPTNTWTNLWYNKPSWWQAVANTDGSLAAVYWVDGSSQLWRWQNGQSSVINTYVQSVTINAQGQPQVTSNTIIAYWNAIGRPSYLGQPTSGLEVGPNGNGYQVQFSNGVILWDSTYGNRVLYGAMYQYWLAQGGANSSVGVPKSNQQTVSGEAPLQTQAFANGVLYLDNGTVTTTNPTSIIAGVLANITDSGIRSLTQSLFLSAGDIGRTQMLQLFTEVESAGTVTSAEFSSLKVIVSAASQLNIPADVENLAEKVVDGNPANATYQGSMLGNLQAGSSAVQLQKLVDKWFYGTDEPVPLDDYGDSKYTYQLASGSLFGSSGFPSYEDVQQGFVGDCYLLASLSALALKDPQAIQAMIVNNHSSLTPGDNTYTVRLWDSSANSWDYVTVDSYLPTDSNGNLVFNGLGDSASSSSNALWASLIEKAVVQAAQEGWMGRPAVNTYTNISSGWPYQALELVTGTSASQSLLTNANAVVNTWTSTGLVIFDTDVTPPSNNLVANHSYVLVNYNASTGIYTLFNPWGVAGATDASGYRPGYVTMTWSQLVQNMQVWET